MGHWPCPDCCGGVDCLIHSDTFSGSDTTTIANATELDGDWEITSTALHPDHAASDSAIMFTPASSDPEVWAFVQIKDGASGDRLGIALFLDADGDSFVEATLRWGSGTSGRLNMNRFTNGVLDWTHNSGASPACGVNEYDFPAGNDYYLALWHRPVDGGSLWQFRVYEVDAPSQTIDDDYIHEVEYFDSAGIATSALRAGCVTGTDATTGYFDNFFFYHAYSPCDCYIILDLSIMRGEPCDYPGAIYEEEAGDWDLEALHGSTYVVTDSEPATLLFRQVLRAPSSHLVFFDYGSRLFSSIAGPTGDLTFRWFWDWSDDDNYWCVEWVHAGDVDDCGQELRIIERAAGVETVHEVKTGFYNDNWRTASVLVDSNGYVNVNFADFCAENYDCLIGFLCGGPYSFTGTGRIGFKVIDAPDGFIFQRVAVWDGVSPGCLTSSAECETCVDFPDGNPDDPNGCCSEAEDLEVGDEVEFTMTAFDIESGEPCESDPCYSDITTVFLALNNPFTLEVVFVSEVVTILYGDTGVHVTCGGSPGGVDVTAKIWVWITRTGPETCVIRAILSIPTCHVYWEQEITPGTNCLDVDLDYVGRPGDATCCLNFTSSTCRISLP